MRHVRNIAGAALIALMACSPARAQTAPRHYLSAASNNSTLVLGRRASLSFVQATNTTAVIYYLKFYDKATAPTCGTDVPVATIALNATQSMPPIQPALSLLFQNGVGFCLTGGIADNDNTVAATGVTINLGVSAR
jgi:hypothetical protein